MDGEENPTLSDNMKEQDAANIGMSRNNANNSRSLGSSVNQSVYPSNVYAPQAQAFYYRGFDNATGGWDSSFVGGEGLELGSPGIYNDNHSVVFHTGFGYSPAMPYGPYSPVTTPLPPVGGDAYSSQQYPFSGPPYYQQLVSPTMPFITSPTAVSQPALTPLLSKDQQGNGLVFGHRAGYPSPSGSLGRGSFPGNSGMQDLDGFRSGRLWSDWTKQGDRQRSFTPLLPALSPQSIGPFGSIGMGNQSEKPPYGFGCASNSYSTGYFGGLHQSSGFGSASISSLGPNSRVWLALDNGKRRGRGISSLCSCNGTLDVLSEQNRGPRASRPKKQNTAEHGSQLENSKDNTFNIKFHDELYNHADFVTEYENAKFFIIKSYSEDNIHKSIKYGVWASTPNGNRKLDAAYHEAQEKKDACPVFLLFSVNASAQFCGVAEMVGPVDFDKSVDYWQQDKWSGQFPVKWHIIKDVPNTQFRHIVLENNDNKPVTNSRDTQEVKLDQGIEMLNIFKNYETDMSILDDFDYYEERQKAMQERKARQQSSLMSTAVVVGKDEHENTVFSNSFIKHMSKSFAQAVQLDDCGNEGPVSDASAQTS